MRLPPSDVRRAGPPLPGLATERTALAWNRTALALVVNGALIAHKAVRLHGAAEALGWVLAGLAGVAGAVAWHSGGHAYEDLRRAVVAGEPTVRPELIRALSTVTSILAIGAIALVLL